MTRVDLYDMAGKKTGKTELPNKLFVGKINQILMAQAVRVYLANQRQSKAKTKDRSEVRGSSRKIWRQKGTGRARHGDRYAPIFVGGGRAHGPTGNQNYKLKITKKMKKLSLFSALTGKYKEGEIFVVRGLEKVEPKTNKMVLVLGKIVPRPKTGKKAKKLTLVLPGVVDNVIRASRNIKGVNLAQARLLNTYQVLNGGNLVLAEESLTVIREVFLAKPKKKSKQCYVWGVIWGRLNLMKKH